MPEGLLGACWILAQASCPLAPSCPDWSLAWFFTRARQSSSRAHPGRWLPAGRPLLGDSGLLSWVGTCVSTSVTWCFFAQLSLPHGDSFSEPALGALHHLGPRQERVEAPPPQAPLAPVPCLGSSQQWSRIPALLGTWANSELV